MDRALLTSTDGDRPPRRDKIIRLRAYALWTVGTWLWRLAVLAALIVCAVETYHCAEASRLVATSLALHGGTSR